ncbi:MAG: family 20 glycosylhydrolase [Victivallales bacterium]
MKKISGLQDDHMTLNLNAQSSLPPLRGLMLDAARLVESMDCYRRFIDFCAEWKVNSLIFRLTDDQGCALRFRSHPELLTHSNALTPDDMRGLAEYARTAGVELIPEIESLGHTQYITRSAEHADLNDKGADGPDWANAIIPLHPGTMKLLGDLYEEAAGLFPSHYLHVGCDETNWGGSAFSQQQLATRSRAEIWGDFLNALHEKVCSLGRQMIIWDDVVLQHDPAILDRLDRRIILHDWNYWDSSSEPVTARLAKARDKGFRMIGGPALHWAKWGLRVGAEQLRNIDAYINVYLKGGESLTNADGEEDDCPTLAVIVTNWCPARYIRDSIWDGLAYSAVAMNEGSAQARATAFPRFVENHYGTAWNDVWADIFDALHASAPARQGEHSARLLVPWANEDELQKAIDAEPLPSLPFESILKKLDALQQMIRRNHADFDAFRLSIAYLNHLYWRHVAVRGLEGRGLAKTITEIARRDSVIAEKLAVDWRSGRTGDPMTQLDQAAIWGFGPEDWLHGRFQQAAQFSTKIVESKSSQENV